MRKIWLPARGIDSKYIDNFIVTQCMHLFKTPLCLCVSGMLIYSPCTNVIEWCGDWRRVT